MSHVVVKHIRLVAVIERNGVVHGVRVFVENTAISEDWSIFDFIFSVYGVANIHVRWINGAVDSHLFSIVHRAYRYALRKEYHNVRYLMGDWVHDLKKWSSLSDGSYDKLPVLNTEKGLTRNSNMVMIQNVVEEQGLFVGAIGVRADGGLSYYAKSELVRLFKAGALHNAHFKNVEKVNSPGFSSNRGKFSVMDIRDVRDLPIRDFHRPACIRGGVD